MNVKYYESKQEIKGETRDNYRIETIKREIIRNKAMNLLKKGKWASYKKYIIEYQEGYILIENGQKLMIRSYLTQIEAYLHNKEKKNIKIIVND